MMPTLIIPPHRHSRPGHGEDGFVLVTALLVLLLLLVLGVSTIDTSNIELLIAANEKLSSKGFYNGDGGGEVGAVLVEENLSCPQGFQNGTLISPPVPNPGKELRIDTTSNSSNDPVNSSASTHTSLAFYQNNLLMDVPDAEKVKRGAPFVSDSKRDAYYPQDYFANPASPAPHTNLRYTANTTFGKGAGLEMAAGYEGRGKGAGSGGAVMLIDIYSQYVGEANDNTTVLLQWRHVVGMEGSCNY